MNSTVAGAGHELAEEIREARWTLRSMEIELNFKRMTLNRLIERLDAGTQTSKDDLVVKAVREVLARPRTKTTPEAFLPQPDGAPLPPQTVAQISQLGESLGRELASHPAEDAKSHATVLLLTSRLMRTIASLPEEQQVAAQVEALLAQQRALEKFRDSAGRQ